MTFKTIKKISLRGLVVFSIYLVACKEDTTLREVPADVTANQTVQPILKAAAVDLPGRTLASNCFQCHGTNGYAQELKIAGESSNEIIGEMNEMKAKNPRSNIMNVHAAAYTPAEIKLIADFFSKQ